jgi:hypothetical protein
MASAWLACRICFASLLLPHSIKFSGFTMSQEKSYSRYQQNVIRRYYENADSIGLQRAQELVTELYLAEGKKRLRVWDSLEKALSKAGFKAEQIARLREQDDPAQVAQLLTKKV